MAFLGWTSSRDTAEHISRLSPKTCCKACGTNLSLCHMGCQGSLLQPCHSHKHSSCQKFSHLVLSSLPAAALPFAEKCTEKGSGRSSCLSLSSARAWIPWQLLPAVVSVLHRCSRDASLPPQVPQCTAGPCMGIVPRLSCCHRHKGAALLLLTQALHLPVNAKLSKLRLFPSLACVCGFLLATFPPQMPEPSSHSCCCANSIDSTRLERLGEKLPADFGAMAWSKIP